MVTILKVINEIFKVFAQKYVSIRFRIAPSFESICYLCLNYMNFFLHKQTDEWQTKRDRTYLNRVFFLSFYKITDTIKYLLQYFVTESYFHSLN